MSQYQELQQRLQAMNLTDEQRELIENKYFVTDLDQALFMANQFEFVNRRQLLKQPAQAQEA